MNDQNDRWIDKWGAVPWTQVQGDVSRIQKRIFRSALIGNRQNMQQLQRLLVSSSYAKLWAVKLAAEDSTGKGTPGIDGIKNLTDAQKLSLAQSLTLHHRPKPVRRTMIPKPGSDEERPLSIPTIADRAFQHLLALALEPEWEARFTPGMYGFRKGRGCHDALLRIRLAIQRCPQWVLDGDIEKFFDRLDHQALLRKLDTFPAMEVAVRRTLKSGVLVDNVLEPTEKGTPQGGPLSPLVANIALCGLETDLQRAFSKGTVVAGHRVRRPPSLILYADDFVVLHENRAAIMAVRSFIEDWLQPLGLNLHPSKTRIVHTLEREHPHGPVGFEFLGCRVQQFRVGKYAISPYFKGVYTNIRPSQKAIAKLLSRCDEILRVNRPNKRRNAAYQHRQKRGAYGPIAVIIHKLNEVLRGWADYHRYHNSKQTFSKVDSLLFRKVWVKARRTFRHKGSHWLVRHLFNGGNPWCFTAPDGPPGKKVALYSTADTPIQQHILVQSGRSFFDGDWAYWGGRLGRYPGIPSAIGRLLKAQYRKCPVCQQAFIATERPLPVIRSSQSGRYPQKQALVHPFCSKAK